MLRIDLNDVADWRLEIMSLNGTERFVEQCQQCQEFLIETLSLASGTYLLSVENASKKARGSYLITKL